jgi:hypothetical protein
MLRSVLIISELQNIIKAYVKNHSLISKYIKTLCIKRLHMLKICL